MEVGMVVILGKVMSVEKAATKTTYQVITSKQYPPPPHDKDCPCYSFAVFLIRRRFMWVRIQPRISI
jgi:hypothetical protein